jgi:hypothetical protein
VEETNGALQPSAAETNAARELRPSELKRLESDKLAAEREKADKRDQQVKADALEKIRRLQELEEARKAKDAAVAEHRLSYEGTLVAYHSNRKSLTMEDFLRIISHPETSKDIQTTCMECILALTNEKSALIESLTNEKSELKSHAASLTDKLAKAVKQIADYGDQLAENLDATNHNAKKTSKKHRKQNKTADATAATAPTAATADATAATAPTAAPTDATAATAATADATAATAPTVATADATAATAPTVATADATATVPKCFLIMQNSVKTETDELKKLEEALDASKQRLSHIGDKLKSLDVLDVSDEATALHDQYAAERDVCKTIMGDIKAQATLITTLEALIMCVQTATRIDIACDAMKDFMEMTKSVAGTNTPPTAASLVASTNTKPTAASLVAGTNTKLLSFASVARDPTPAESRHTKTSPALPPTSSRCPPVLSPDTMVRWLQTRPDQIEVGPECHNSVKLTMRISEDHCPIVELGCAQSSTLPDGLDITPTMLEFLNQVVVSNVPLNAELLKRRLIKKSKIVHKWNLRACHVIERIHELLIVVILYGPK